MLVLIAIGWLVVLPILVVVGLWAVSRLREGRAQPHAVLDATALAREFVGATDSASPEPAEVSPPSGQPAGVGY